MIRSEKILQLMLIEYFITYVLYYYDVPTCVIWTDPQKKMIDYWLKRKR
jgi:hypothetical protein